MHKQPVNGDAKGSRHAAILDAIRASAIGTQGDLVRALARKGIEAAQASVSRDIAELGLVKAGGRYVAAPAVTGVADPELALRTDVVKAVAAGPNLVVIHCQISTAQSVGLALDHFPHPGKVGTLAGDDTVFAAVDSAESGKKLIRYLEERIGGGKKP